MADGEKVVIELDLGNLWVDGERGGTFGEYVAGIAATRLLEREGAAGDEMRRRVRATTEEEIRVAVRPMIERALEESLQPTDAFGTPRGAPTTLRELVVATARKELSEKRDRGHRNPRATIVEEFVKEAVQTTLRAEMQEAVKEAKAQVMVAVREQAAQVIQETVERVAAGRPV